MQVDHASISQPAVLWGPLGDALVASPPPAEQRLPLLNEVWRHVTLVDDAQTYLGESIPERRAC